MIKVDKPDILNVVMVKNQKKICIIVATYIKHADQGDDFLLTAIPELSIIADIDFIVLAFDAHTDSTPKEWMAIAQAIDKNKKKYDGFVVIHSIDSLLYASAAVGLLLHKLGKPVVFTGGTTTDFSSRSAVSGVKANVINAVQVATYSFAETCLMFGNQLIRAATASIAATDSLNAFNAPVAGVLGRIDFSIRIMDKQVRKATSSQGIDGKIESAIRVIEYTPLLPIDQCELTANTKAVVIRLADYRSVPSELLDIMQDHSGAPFVLWGPFLQQELPGYKNVIIVTAMTWHTTVVKTAWAVSRNKTISSMRKTLETSFIKEIIE